MRHSITIDLSLSATMKKSILTTFCFLAVATSSHCWETINRNEDLFSTPHTFQHSVNQQALHLSGGDTNTPASYDHTPIQQTNNINQQPTWNQDILPKKQTLGWGLKNFLQKQQHRWSDWKALLDGGHKVYWKAFPILTALISFATFGVTRHCFSAMFVPQSSRKIPTELHLLSGSMVGRATLSAVPWVSFMLAALVAHTLSILMQRQSTIQLSVVQELKIWKQMQQLVYDANPSLSGFADSERQVLVDLVELGMSQLQRDCGAYAMGGKRFESQNPWEIPSSSQDLLQFCSQVERGIYQNLDDDSNNINSQQAMSGMLQNIQQLDQQVQQERFHRWMTMASARFSPVHYSVMACLGVTILFAFSVQTADSMIVLPSLRMMRVLWSLLVTSMVAIVVLLTDLSNPFRSMPALGI